MKILVTGGAGYIGSHTTYELIDKGYDVVVVDNLSKGFKSNVHPKATFYKVDLRDEKELIKVFEKEKDIKAVMHFAGYIVVPESVSKPLEYFDNNFHSVEILLKVMNVFDIKHFVFSSTAAVYGEPKKIPILETDEKSPINPYGNSKLAAEYLIKDWANAYGTNYVIFRYFNVAGTNKNGKIGIKGQVLTHLVPIVIDAALDTSKTMNVYGNDYETRDGSCIRDFVHVVDLAQAHILGLEWSIKNKKSDIFNIGSSTGFSVLEVLSQAKKSLNINIKSKIVGRRDGDPATLLASTAKIEFILKWKPKKSLDDIIKTEFNFRKKWNENKTKE